MKKILSMLLILSMVLAITPAVDITPVFATQTVSQTDSSSLWDFEEYGDGVMLNAYHGTQIDVYVPNKVEKDGVEYNVVKLADGIFANSALNSATLGEGITEIGKNAFANSTSLVCIVTPQSLTTIGDGVFSGCTSFNSIILYDTVTSIGADAFFGCSTLTIYCNEGSTAYTYAVDNSIPYELLNAETTPETYVIDGVTYYIKSGKVILTAYDDSVTTNVVIPATVNGYPVTSIGTVFQERNLTSVSLPDSITKIDNYAFWDCPNLSNVSLPKSLKTIGQYAFQDCRKLRSITIPDGVTTIGNYAFRSSNLSNGITLPDSLTSIGSYAFKGCSLYNITIPNSVRSIGIYAFSDCYVLQKAILPENITYISNYAFNNCMKLSSITLPSKVTSIGDYAFYQCSSLKSITIPDKVTYIGSNAFYKCTGISKINIPDSVRTIGDGVFLGCTALSDITLSKSLTSIGEKAFQGCTALQEVIIPENVKTLSSYLFWQCSNLTSVSLPEGLTTIKDSAFSQCYKLSNVNIPKNVTKIGTSAFTQCQSLTDITIPSGVTELPQLVFNACTSLKSITIPEGVTTFGNLAFSGCTSLQTIRIPESTSSINTTAFPTSTILLVYENSYAHTFAQDNNLLYYVVTGDEIPELYNIDGVIYCIFDGCAVAISFDNSQTEVTIPSSVEGYPVTELRGAFKNSSIVNITLPDTLKSISEQTFYGCSSLKAIEIPDSVTTIGDAVFYNCTALETAVLPKNITEIPKTLFRYCENLTSVNVPDGVTKIGDYAFDGCKSLLEIIFPDTLKTIGGCAFQSCKSLTSIAIPEGITSLDSYIFNACSSLREVILPSTLTILKSEVFKSCSSLPAVIIPKSVIDMTHNTFPKTTTLFVYENTWPHSVAVNNGFSYFILEEGSDPKICIKDDITYCIMNGEAIGLMYKGTKTTVTVPEEVDGYPVTELRGTFANSSVTSVTLPDSLKIIGDNTFNNCTSLRTVNIPDGVECIGVRAFADCRVMGNVTLPDTLKTLASHAFFNCFYITQITIPGTVKHIGERAFYQNKALRTVVMEEGVESIAINAFCMSTKLSSVTLPDSMTSIGPWAFSSCNAIKSLRLPANLQTIGEWAFSGCGFTTLNIPDTVTSIGSSAFRGCTSLKEIAIPDTVTFIGSSLFDSCSQLESVTLPSYLTIIPYMMFNDCVSLTEFNIPAHITTIAQNAFCGCTGLAMVKIPETITTMYAKSFEGTTLLLVYENSYAHTFAEGNSLLHFVIKKTDNPEIAYGASVSGTVTYTDGTPVSGAKVEILYDDGTVKEDATTDANGNYTFKYAEVGRYTLRATDTNNVTSTEQFFVKRMNVFDVFLAGETNLTLNSSWNVSGAVSPTTATINLTDIDGHIINATTTTDGNYTITNVPNGTYLIKAETENGSAVKEITVSNADLTVEDIIVSANSATVTGKVQIKDRDNNFYHGVWAHVAIYNSNGEAVDWEKTDKDGNFTFKNLPVDKYGIVAQIDEMRPDRNENYDHPHHLKGFAYVNVETETSYDVGTIVLYEISEHTTKLSGKVKSHGETPLDSEVLLSDIFRDEVVSFKTSNNGKYTFKKVQDGLYFITARTQSNGMGYTVVAVINGKVYGETDIIVYKKDKIKDREDKFRDFYCDGPDDAKDKKDRIKEEKEFYDSLSEKEKKELSDDYVERLFRYIGYISGCDSYEGDGVKYENGGSLVSGDEIDEEKQIELVLNIEERKEHQIGDDGIKDDDDFVQQSIRNNAGDREIVKYYDISLTKDGKPISNIQKQTDTSGKLRITMDIPEEYRGYKHYSFVHMHNGVAQTLVDLDDNPNTITFEVDRFSTFALTATNDELTEESPTASIVYDNAKITVTSEQKGILYLAKYNDHGTLLSVSVNNITANTPVDFDFDETMTAYLWDENMVSLCDEFKVSN